MKLLIVTQALDQSDPVLSVYHDWVAALSKGYEHVEVICLKQGKYQLPEHVQVHSLGKERGRQGALIYALRFLSLAWTRRSQYDAVFVHMNQEYILLAGILWKMLGKRIYFWRNHYAGSWFTDIAAAFSEKVFCTSKDSYTARYAKTVRMPVGVDTTRFASSSVSQSRSSILFLARMASSKRPHLLIEALALLKAQGRTFTASFVGSPLPDGEAYYQSLIALVKEKGLRECVTFVPGVPHEEVAQVFSKHALFVNTSPSGMLDKTLFEAAASGCIILSASEDLKEALGDRCFFDGTVESLAAALIDLLSLSEEEYQHLKGKLKTLADTNSLSVLMERLTREIQ